MSDTVALLVAARNALGFNIPIRPFEKVIACRITDDTVTLSIETYRYVETKTRIKFNKKGWRMVSYNRATLEVTTISHWDESYEPEEIAKFGNVRTPEAYIEKLGFERACHRPGSPRSPLDNYDRTELAPASPAMRRHWK